MFSNDSPLDDGAAQSPSDADPIRSDSIHRGYDLEGGLLARSREWTDLLPWLRLTRTLRAVGSPPIMMLVGLTFAIWIAGHVNLLGDWLAGGRSAPPTTISSNDSLRSISIQLRAMVPTQIFEVKRQGPWWHPVAAALWALLVSLPAVLFLLRQGALLTAGRPMMGFLDGLKYSLRRSPYALVVAAVPLLCVCFVMLAIVMLGWISQLHEVVAMVLSPIVVLVALVCGLLAFGSNVAVPFGWAALVNEKDADPLDSLSRGYEYIYRRPLPLALYAVVCLAILSVVIWIAIGVTTAAASIAMTALNLVGASPRMIAATGDWLRWFPSLVGIASFWSLLGGVYLLMRRDTCGQEVEDIWQPSPSPPQSLPELTPSKTE